MMAFTLNVEGWMKASLIRFCSLNVFVQLRIGASGSCRIQQRLSDSLLPCVAVLSLKARETAGAPLPQFHPGTEGSIAQNHKLGSESSEISSDDDCIVLRQTKFHLWCCGVSVLRHCLLEDAIEHGSRAWLGVHEIIDHPKTSDQGHRTERMSRMFAHHIFRHNHNELP